MIQQLVARWLRGMAEFCDPRQTLVNAVQAQRNFHPGQAGFTFQLPALVPPANPPPATVTVDQEIIAWRWWKLQADPDGTGGYRVRLVSPNRGVIWDGPSLRIDPATELNLDFQNTKPGPGIYAVKTLATLQANVFPGPGSNVAIGSLANPFLFCEQPTNVVLGTVALSGRVVEHQAGYRAEQAMVRSLRILCSDQPMPLWLAQEALLDYYQATLEEGDLYAHR